MKVVCDRVALLDGLTATSFVTAARTPKPILQCVRITAEKDRLTLTAYDQELGLRYHLSEGEIEVSRPGETLLPGARILEIARESVDETLAFELQGDTCHVRGGNTHFQIFGQDPREFPPVTDLEGEADFTVKAEALRGCMERTLFAAARESTRYAINGVLWEKRGRKLNLISTDGRRLARATTTLEKSRGDEATAIVPTKLMNTFTRLHLQAEDTVDVKTTPNQIFIRSPRATLSSVLLEGHFPKYDDVIPQDCDKKIEPETESFLRAIRQAALLTSEESKGVKIALSSDGIIFSSRAPTEGEATIRLSIPYSGPAMEIGFNPAYLIDALRVCGPSVTFEVKETNKPGVLREGSDFLYVVMPVSLS
jgi:DNA polymerase-3 subunit beta